MFTIPFEKLYLGPTPPEEPCAQVGCPNYREQALKECRAYIRQLERIFGEPPPGARFALSRESHDFGTYYEVVIQYDVQDEDSNAFVFRVEANLPATWDIQAREELGSDAAWSTPAPHHLLLRDPECEIGWSSSSFRVSGV
jgi:hypothetical protein